MAVSNCTSTHLTEWTRTRRLSGGAHLELSAQGVTGASGDSDSDSAGRVGSEALCFSQVPRGLRRWGTEGDAMSQGRTGGLSLGSCPQ